MATTYPTSKQDLDATRGAAADKMNSPNHVTHHNNSDDTVEALQDKLGTGASNQDAASGKLLRGTGAKATAWDKDAPTGTIVGTTDTQTLSNKTIGGSQLVANSVAGSKITATDGLLRTITYYTSDDTWTKPSGLKFVIVDAVSGGGGAGAATSNESIGGGGGGGGYSRKKIAVGTLGATEAITIGAAGTGGVGGNGGAGGTTSFGALISITGGSGGLVNGGQPATAGIGSDGDLNIRGSQGGRAGNNATSASGTGGGSVFGPGGSHGTRGSGGLTGTGLGAGGGGGHRSNVSKNGAGGTKGLIIVTEYF